MSLSRQRCFLHSRREAVARCPACGRFYCRECITEHEGRFLCADCLASRTAGRAAARGGGLAAAGVAAGGLLLAWLCFFYLGRLLLIIPSSFHEGNLWKGF